MSTAIPQNIYFIQGDDFTENNTAKALVLLENGWILHISQSNGGKHDINLAEAIFTCTTLRINERGTPDQSSAHGIEAFERHYIKHNMSLSDIEETLKALEKLEATSPFSALEILKISNQRHFGYKITQIGGQPVHCGSGAFLNADKLQENMRDGKFRDSLDRSSPYLHQPFKDNEIQLRTMTPENGQGSFLYGLLLLETGHAILIRQIKAARGEDIFQVDLLVPDEKLLLQTSNLDINELFKGFGHLKLRTNKYFTKPEITEIANALLREGPITPPHTLQAIVARNKNDAEELFLQSGPRAVTQFNRVQFNEDTGIPLGTTVTQKPVNQGWSADFDTLA